MYLSLWLIFYLLYVYKMESWKVLYSKWNNDECYTPQYWVEPIIKYIKNSNIIRCPFDTEESNFVKLLRKEWFTVISSHIDEWQDFYTYEPEQRDIIISNPPFTNKRKIFERCLSFNKPFALLMSNTRLNDSAPKQLFKEKELQLLMFDKRIEYSWNKKITFSSSYYCYNILPKQIIMEFINKKNKLCLI